jgi:hypothetical protein
MSWVKVKRGKKPLGWWYHKIMCEIGWSLRNTAHWDLYYCHLAKMCSKYHINLYGEPLPYNDDIAIAIKAQRAYAFKLKNK